MERALEEQSLGVRLGRNVWSVTVGFVVMFMLAALAFIVIAFSFPPSYRIPTGQPPPVWITQTYAVTLVLASILGGYITAGMGSRRNLASVFILAFCWFMVSLFFWRGEANQMAFEVIRMGVNAGLVILGGHLQIYRHTYRLQASSKTSTVTR